MKTRSPAGPPLHLSYYGYVRLAPDVIRRIRALRTATRRKDPIVLLHRVG